MVERRGRRGGVAGKEGVWLTCQRSVAAIQSVRREPLKDKYRRTTGVHAKDEDEAPRLVVVGLCKDRRKFAASALDPSTIDARVGVRTRHQCRRPGAPMECACVRDNNILCCSKTTIINVSRECEHAVVTTRATL